VVADEVRSLAQRAAEAVHNSATIIERTLGDVAKGVRLVGQAHAAFQEVSAKISGGAQIVSQIASISSEQAQRIESLTQRNVANAQQTADGASAMTSQVETCTAALATWSAPSPNCRTARRISRVTPRTTTRTIAATIRQSASRTRAIW
jgi:methyl-accepting chemotaxis protein